jgi:2-oxoisovalerate dehydrogenase E1 component
MQLGRASRSLICARLCRGTGEVLASVRRTSRCLIVHEDFQLAGFGAEIAAVVADEAFLDLDAPVLRLAAPSIPVPFNTGLMDGMIPRVDQIRERMAWLLGF